VSLTRSFVLSFILYDRTRSNCLQFDSTCDKSLRVKTNYDAREGSESLNQNGIAVSKTRSFVLSFILYDRTRSNCPQFDSTCGKPLRVKTNYDAREGSESLNQNGIAVSTTRSFVLCV